MDTELSGTLSGLDVSTPPGVNEIGQQIGHSNLYIKNLPADIDEPALWQLFSRCGTIEAGAPQKHCRLQVLHALPDVDRFTCVVCQEGESLCGKPTSRPCMALTIAGPRARG